jgi:hypothetical protein
MLRPHSPCGLEAQEFHKGEPKLLRNVRGSPKIDTSVVSSTVDLAAPDDDAARGSHNSIGACKDQRCCGLKVMRMPSPARV